MYNVYIYLFYSDIKCVLWQSEKNHGKKTN